MKPSKAEGVKTYLLTRTGRICCTVYLLYVTVQYGIQKKRRRKSHHPTARRCAVRAGGVVVCCRNHNTCIRRSPKAN